MILTGGSGQRALDRAFHEVFGVPRAFGAILMAGRTDPLIIREACERHAVDARDGHMDELLQRYFVCLEEELARPSAAKRVLPGVIPLLESLHRDGDAILALLTGNLPRSARLKLEHFGLSHYFATGAFGDDAPERNGLVPVATERVSALGHGRIPPGRIVVIGDTPHDVACARAAGAHSIAVATGGSTVDELDTAGAAVALADLSATADVLARIEALVEAEPLGRG